MQDPLTLYLEEIGRYPLLTADQERDLFKTLRATTDPEDEAAKAADAAAKTRARNTLIQSNLRLVVNVAKRYQGKGLGLPDLISEGNFGLMKAVELFNPELKFRLSTYATFCIVSYIERDLNTHATTLRVPENVAAVRRKWHKAEGRLSALLGRSPTFDEVADHMGLNESFRDRVAKATLATTPCCEEIELDRLVADEVRDDGVPEEALRLLDKSLGLLKERARDIVSLTYGLGGRDPLNGPDVGRVYKISRERVRQILQDSIELMRRSG